MTMFWQINDWMSHAMKHWPNFAVLGFTLSWGAALITLPVFLLFALCALWSIASVGIARKTFSSIFVVALALTAYPVLTLLVLMIIWFVLALAALALSCIVPLICTFSGIWMVGAAVCAYMEDQR